jgi:hypothetical protein
MDNWLTLDKVALELKETEREILNLATEGGITLTWQSRDFIELYHIDYSNWDDSYGPKSVIRAGFFEIDLALCPDWESPLNDLKLGGKGYGLVFDPIGPLVVREVGPDGYIWSVTPPPEVDTSKELDFPTIQTLGVFRKELDRYKNQLGSKISKGRGRDLMPRQESAILELFKIEKITLRDVPQSCKKALWNKIDLCIKAKNKSESIPIGLEIYSAYAELFLTKKTFELAWSRLNTSGEITTHR